MKEKMYIHSTDSSCEKTKQEKQKNFSILLLKKQKKPWKNENCPMKKTTPQPSEIKKENLILTLCATNFYMPFVFFVMFYHTLLLPSTTLKKTKKNLVSYYVFLSFFFSSFRNFSYVLGKIAGKCWQWKETKKFSLS